MKRNFTLTLALVFAFGLTMAMAGTVTAQLTKKPEKGISFNYTKIEFNDKGKARTKTTLSPGSSVSYSIERPKTGYEEIKWTYLRNKRKGSSFIYGKVEWTLKEDGKTIQSGKFGSTNRIRIDSGNGYYKITLTNVSENSAPLNLAWRRKSCDAENLQECTISKSKSGKRLVNGTQVLPNNKKPKNRRVKRTDNR